MQKVQTTQICDETILLHQYTHTYTYIHIHIHNVTHTHTHTHTYLHIHMYTSSVYMHQDLLVLEALRCRTEAADDSDLAQMYDETILLHQYTHTHVCTSRLACHRSTSLPCKRCRRLRFVTRLFCCTNIHIIYIHTYTHIHIYNVTHTHANMHTYLHTHMYTCICIKTWLP